ncbi:MAG: threonine synthase [Elusimicrobiota bacterium]|jgi:threonine synthase|nr:threonine synthase [Elusimicrobiota bacterium]
MYKGLIEKYKRFLPISDKTEIVSLLEGNTPLIKANNLKKILNVNFDIYLKYEGLNPTGSFKDRGMSMALTKAKEEGAKSVICASTGNTSASAAAYSARAGLKCIVLIPDGNIAFGKLSQALIHNAKVIAINGNFDDALKIVREISEKLNIVLVNSINPYRIEGQKTASFEIIEDLGDAPDYNFIPVGNAGNISAYWKGYKEYRKNNLSTKLPKMMGFEAAGAAPIVLGEPIEKPETIATAIKIGNPASWKSAEEARDESGGVIDVVTDEEILSAYRMLAKYEGIFCEPASSTSLAGLIKYINKKDFEIEKNTKVVCILTGHGLKDPDNAIKNSDEIIKIKADIKEIEKIINF